LKDAVAPVAGSRCFTDELVHGGPDEIGKLDLGDGAHAPECGPESYPHDGCFSQGGIDDPRFAELINEALSRKEYTTALPHVLAHDENLGVPLHLFAQGFSNSLNDVLDCHYSTYSL
jgi:hypothetical protein